MWTKEASAWLKDQKDAFTGQRASAPPRVLPAQEKAKRKELAGEARAFSTEWAGNLAPQMARAPFVVHRGLVPSALRGELLEMHKRALPKFKDTVGGHVHDAKGQRTVRVVMEGLRPLTGEERRNYRANQLFHPTQDETDLLKKVMAEASTASGREVSHMSEMVLLLAAPGMETQRWHVDAKKQFLGLLINASAHAVSGTEFIDAPTISLATGVKGRDGQSKRAAMEKQWELASQPDPPLIAAEGGLGPGDAIHTNPLHVHRAPPMPPASEPDVLPPKKRKHAAVPSEYTEDVLRRIIFVTYGSRVSAEAAVYFSGDTWLKDQ